MAAAAAAAPSPSFLGPARGLFFFLGRGPRSFFAADTVRSPSEPRPGFPSSFATNASSVSCDSSVAKPKPRHSPVVLSAMTTHADTPSAAAFRPSSSDSFVVDLGRPEMYAWYGFALAAASSFSFRSAARALRATSFSRMTASPPSSSICFFCASVSSRSAFCSMRRARNFSVAASLFDRVLPPGCARRGFPGSPWPSFFGPLAKRRPRASFFALSVAGAGAAAATLADMLL
mmetsp:Transcript_14023/g.43470  ORF Transcript_14023/g.43470 Transcript_14023/m.43470 type:complete len:232 (+) Transcript_14023:906-1601(+)